MSRHSGDLKHEWLLFSLLGRVKNLVERKHWDLSKITFTAAVVFDLYDFNQFLLLFLLNLPIMFRLEWRLISCDVQFLDGRIL